MSGTGSLGGADRVQAHPQAVFRELAGDQGGVLLQLESGGYHGVNAMGCFMWSLIADGLTIDELVAGVRGHVTDPPDHLETDVVAFIETLRDRDLVTVSPPES